MRRVELDHSAKIAWVKNGNIALASFAFEHWGGANKAQMAAESYATETDESPWELRNRIAHLEAQVAAADALAREVERIATHKHKEMGLDYGRPHHPAYPELFRRLAVYEAKKGHTE